MCVRGGGGAISQSCHLMKAQAWAEALCVSLSNNFLVNMYETAIYYIIFSILYSYLVLYSELVTVDRFT